MADTRSTDVSARATPATDPLPASAAVLRPRKWTTKVNFAMVIAVLIVLVIGVVAALQTQKEPPQSPPTAAE